jgi:hypothetical protein
MRQLPESWPRLARAATDARDWLRVLVLELDGIPATCDPGGLLARIRTRAAVHAEGLKGALKSPDGPRDRRNADSWRNGGLWRVADGGRGKGGGPPMTLRQIAEDDRGASVRGMYVIGVPSGTENRPPHSGHSNRPRKGGSRKTHQRDRAAVRRPSRVLFPIQSISAFSSFFLFSQTQIRCPGLSPNTSDSRVRNL